MAEGLVLAGLAMLIGGALHRPRRATPETVCLGNMKQILTAIRMYLNDNGDTLPPAEARPEVAAYFRGEPGRGGPGEREKLFDWLVNYECRLTSGANPYLRWPVVLEPYLRARSVWRCPSAQLETPALFVIGPSDWLSHLQQNEEAWGSGEGKLCLRRVFPRGWGGETTDSVAQGRLAVPASATGIQLGPAALRGEPGRRLSGVFAQSIAYNGSARGARVSQVMEPERYVICADGGGLAEDISSGTLAYPDLCGLECANPLCGWVDWEEECTWAADCGLYNHAPKNGSLLRDPELRRPYSRHRGGVNIGFLDGHAEWYDSEKVLMLSPTRTRRGELQGYLPWGRTSDCEPPEGDADVPTLY